MNSGIYGFFRLGCALAATALVALPGSGVSAKSRAGEKVLYDFAGGNDGIEPSGALVASPIGDLYGATAVGGGGSGCDDGSNGCGTLFELSPKGSETVLYRFTGGSDGAIPIGPLIMDGSGNLLGTAKAGGSVGDGAVFKVAPDGTETTLYSFQGQGDGMWPQSGLIMDVAGNLFGTTSQGGTVTSECTDGCGTIFEVLPNGSKTTLYAFRGGCDGWGPEGSLIQDANGFTYGTTITGGTNCEGDAIGCGTVFKISPSGTETQLHTFGGGSDGAFPEAGLVMDSGGNLYGTTGGGGGKGNKICGSGGCGTVFKIAVDGTETILYAFKGGADGLGPDTSLVMDSSGNLYGMASDGGSCKHEVTGCGVLFKVTAGGKETVLIEFNGPHGENPDAGLLLVKGKLLYGTTSVGGPSGYGVAFRVKK